MHITYRYEKNLNYVEMNTNNPSPRLGSILPLIDKRITDLRREVRSIRQICVKLSQFLKANAITPINDDMLEYLRHFLNEEQQKRAANCNNAEIIRGLEQMIEDYTQEMSLHTNRSASADARMDTDQFNDPRSIEEIFILIQQLYALPINGRSIQEQVERIKNGQIHDVSKQEVYVDLPTGRCSTIMSNLQTLVNQKHR